MKEGSFEWALSHLKQGRKARKIHWLPDLWIRMDLLGFGMGPYLVLETTTGEESPWFPTYPDLFRDDWELVDG
jgi:hypothetical protein